MTDAHALDSLAKYLLFKNKKILVLNTALEKQVCSSKEL